MESRVEKSRRGKKATLAVNWSFGILHKLICTGGFDIVCAFQLTPVQADWVETEEEKPWHCLAQGHLPPVKENKKGSDTDGFWQSWSTQAIAQGGAE